MKKIYPRLDLANGNQWRTFRNEIVGPFETTSLFTNKNIPIFKCTKTQQLYDVYGVEIDTNSNIEYVSFKRLKKTTIKEEIIKPKTEQHIGRGLRDVQPNKIFDILSGNEISLDEFRKMTGKQLFNQHNKLVENLDVNTTKLMISKAQRFIDLVDYKFLQNICNCEECQTAKSTLGLDIDTNTVQTIKHQYSYLTKVMKVKPESIIELADFSKLPVWIHHLFVRYYNLVMLDNGASEAEAFELLTDYEIGQYKEHQFDECDLEEIESIFQSYNFLSIDKKNYLLDNSNSILIERIVNINGWLAELYDNTNIHLIFDIKFLLDNNQAIKLNMIENFFNKFIATAPIFKEQKTITVIFEFGNNLYDDPSYAIVNRNPTQPEVMRFIIDSKNTLESITQKINESEKILGKTPTEFDFGFDNIQDLIKEENHKELNLSAVDFIEIFQPNSDFKHFSISHIDNSLFEQKQIDKYVNSLGLGLIPRYSGGSELHYRKKLIQILEEKVSYIRKEKLIGIEITLVKQWNNISIPELIKIVYFVDQWVTSVLTPIGKRTEPRFLLFEFSASFSMVKIEPTIEPDGIVRETFSRYYLYILNKIEKPVKRKIAKQIVNNVIANDRFYFHKSLDNSIWGFNILSNDWAIWYNTNNSKLIHNLTPGKIKTDIDNIILSDLKELGKLYPNKIPDLSHIKPERKILPSSISLEELKANPDMRGIVENIGKTIPLDFMFTEKKPYKKTIMWSDSNEIDLLQLAKDWYANPENTFDVIAPFWMHQWNTHDMGRFIDFMDFKAFYKAFKTRKEFRLIVVKDKYFIEDYHYTLTALYTTAMFDDADWTVHINTFQNRTEMYFIPVQNI